MAETDRPVQEIKAAQISRKMVSLTIKIENNNKREAFYGCFPFIVGALEIVFSYEKLPFLSQVRVTVFTMDWTIMLS